MNEFFAQVRRAGFDIGVSTAKLTQAMVEVLSQLPPDALLSKVVVVRHLGLLVRMSKTRDINSAWNSAKRRLVREFSDRFWLDGKTLRMENNGKSNQIQRLLSGITTPKSIVAESANSSDDVEGSFRPTDRRDRCNCVSP